MDRQSRESNIYLIGMMGSGKTTVGKLLAEKLNYCFFDTDNEVRVKNFECANFERVNSKNGQKFRI